MKYTTLIAFVLPLATAAQRILPVTRGPSSANVTALETYDNKLWVAGHFFEFNGQPVHGLAVWDGQAVFDPLQNSSVSYVFDLQPFNSGIAISGLSLTSDDILFWTGDTLVPLSGEFNAGVYALSVYDGELYAGGNFSNVSGEPVKCLAKWTGSQWVQVGPGLSNSVKCMTVHAGQLYIGGSFTSSGDGQSVLQHVAVWNGTTFSALGAGLSSGPRSMLSVNGELWMAGDFGFTADSLLQTNGRATWDGSSFGQLAPDETYLSPPLNVVDLDSLGILLSPTFDCTGGSARFANNAWERYRPSRITQSARYNDRICIGGAFMDVLPDTIYGLGVLASGRDRGELRVSGISAFVQPHGTLFYDRNCVDPGLHIGDEDAPSTIFSHSQYVAAFFGDSSFASSYLNFAERGDYSAGPRCDVRDAGMIDRYQHVWFLDKGMLWDQAANWDVPGHQTPDDIITWPGNGNTNNGEPAIMAPYNDLDHDGIYEPGSGELPLTRGDRSAYTVITDQLGDTLNFDRPAQFDIHQLVYGFDDVNEPSLFQTVLVSYQFINRSQRTYDSVLVALTCDPDIGCADDDYIGCDPSLDMFYAYNADSTDQSCNAQPGFGEHPPAEGIAGLNLPMRSFIQLNRDAGQCCNDPDLAPQAINYAKGLWAYGNSQLDPITGDSTLFAFHDYPDVPGGNSGVTSGFAFDVRGIASFGPAYGISPGDTICLDVAFVFARDTTKDNIENVRVLQEKVQAVKAWYAQQPYACGQYPELGVPRATATTIDARLFPNPATSSITIERSQAGKAAQVSIYSMAGQLIMSAPFPAEHHTLHLRTIDLAEGPYAVHVRYDDASQSLRFVKVAATP